MKAYETHVDSALLEKKIGDYKPLFSQAAAVAEANRCLYCYDAPCIAACPTDIDIPTFIREIATHNLKGSARTILSSNVLGYSCARVCPVEVLCAGSCVFNHTDEPPIQIGRLQRFAMEHALRELMPSDLLPRRTLEHPKKIALIGAGPASIAAAALLALEGHRPVIFDKQLLAGGLNTYGVAPYKLHLEDSQQEIEWLLNLGIEARTGVEVVLDVEGPGQIQASSLLDDFDAIFIGVGAGPDSTLAIEGLEGEGVWGATELIEAMKSQPGFELKGVRSAYVIGGGNTAIDVAHELKLLGVDEVVLAYRRSATHMSGYMHELLSAQKSGVRLRENVVPIRVVRERGQMVALELAPAVEGRASSTLPSFSAPTNLVVLAIGQQHIVDLPNAFAGVEVDDQGRVVVDAATHRTGHPQVWAGGDCCNGGKEVVNAVEEAKIAVRSMMEAL